MLLFELNKHLQITDRNEIAKLQTIIKKPPIDVKFYKALLLTDVSSRVRKTINVGDGVLVANADEDHPFVAKVEAFYINGDDSDDDDKFAVVTWFYRQCEVPSYKLPEDCLDDEVFLCTSKADCVIDAETILDTCSIIYDHALDSGDPSKSFYCCKSFDGRRFKSLSRISSRCSKDARIPTTPKTTVSQKSIHSTLTPAKNQKTNSHVASNVLSSAVSASGFRRLDTGSVVEDILESDKGSDFSDSAEDVDKIPTAPKTGKFPVKPKVKSGKKSVHPLYDKDMNSCSPLTMTAKRLKNLSVSVRRMKFEAEKENDTSRRSNRGKSAASIPITPLTKLSVDAEPLSEECDSLDINSLCCENSPSKKAKLNLRRSTRPSAKKKSLPSRKKYDVSSDDESNISDSDADQNFISDGESSSDESDFASSKRSTTRTPKKRTPGRNIFTRSPVRLRKSPKKATHLAKSLKVRRAYIPERKTPIKLAASDFDRARERLHVSAVPDSLPCREEEFQAIYSFIEGKIKSGTGGCMYVSGVPGTGKTATVLEVLSCLRESVAAGTLQDFNYVDINGMRLTEPHQAYVNILKQLKDMKATPDHAADLLTKHFNMRGRKATLMVVDELDLLCTRKQDVLYHIFDWPSHRHARLIVVAIANTMDLPERVMMNKVASRLGLTRLSFLPYSYKQLQDIVSSRLRGLPVFDSDAIQLVARKVAAVSGDARRCLDVCRRAIEIAEKNRIVKKSVVKAANIDEVHEALQEMFASPVVMLMRNCSVHEKLFLRSIVAEFKRSGVEEATLGQLFQHHASLAQIEGLPPSNDSSLIKVCNQLVVSRLVLVESGGHDIYSRVRLNVSVDDVLFALNYD